MRKPAALAPLSLAFVLALTGCGDDDSTGGGGGTTGGTGSTTGVADDADDDSNADSTGNAGATTGGPDADGESSSDDGNVDTTGGDTTDGGDESSTGTQVHECDIGYSTLVNSPSPLATNLTVASALVNCDLDIEIVALGGTVCVDDDGAGGYHYTVELLTFEDFQPVSCGAAQLGLSSLSIANTGDYTEVVVPQAGGDMAGNQSIEILGDAFGSSLLGKIEPTPLEGFVGNLPEGSGSADATTTTVVYGDDVTVLATGMPEVSGQMLTVNITGLSGTLEFDL